jgi:hypothetical protein
VKTGTTTSLGDIDQVIFSPIFLLSDAWINQSIKPPFPKIQQREGKKNNESLENDLKMSII